MNGKKDLMINNEKLSIIIANWNIISNWFVLAEHKIFKSIYNYFTNSYIGNNITYKWKMPMTFDCHHEIKISENILIILIEIYLF